MYGLPARIEYTDCSGMAGCTGHAVFSCARRLDAVRLERSAWTPSAWSLERSAWSGPPGAVRLERSAVRRPPSAVRRPPGAWSLEPGAVRRPPSAWSGPPGRRPPGRRPPGRRPPCLSDCDPHEGGDSLYSSYGSVVRDGCTGCSDWRTPSAHPALSIQSEKHAFLLPLLLLLFLTYYYRYAREIPPK